MLPEKCNKCRIGFAKITCSNCFKKYCSLCANISNSMCEVCNRINPINQDKSKVDHGHYIS